MRRRSNQRRVFSQILAFLSENKEFFQSEKLTEIRDELKRHREALRTGQLSEADADRLAYLILAAATAVALATPKGAPIAVALKKLDAEKWLTPLVTDVIKKAYGKGPAAHTAARRTGSWFSKTFSGRSKAECNPVAILFSEFQMELPPL